MIAMAIADEYRMNIFHHIEIQEPHTKKEGTKQIDRLQIERKGEQEKKPKIQTQLEFYFFWILSLHSSTVYCVIAYKQIRIEWSWLID